VLHPPYEPYKEGDLIWLDGKNLHTSHPMQKLAPKQYGPFKVVDTVNLVSFQLELPLQWKQKKVHPVFHTSLLSPYKEMEEHGANFPEPPPDLVEGEEEYKVEQVLDSRQHGCGKKLQYSISLSGEVIPKPMTAGNLENKYMHQSWWIGFTKKTLRPSGQFA
jgi:hypothetical protein